MPILVRPVREQLEHDRVIRLLQAKYKRKFEVGINPGSEQTVPVGTGPSAWYPDLVLQSTRRGRRLLGVVEVETAESVNNLEAMSQWAAFSRLRAPFHLYVPQSSIDTARRLCANLQISIAEIWAYHLLGDQMRFTLIQRSQGSDGRARAASTAARSRAAARGRSSARARTSRPTGARRAAASGGSARRKAAATKTKTRAAAARKRASGSSRPQKRK